MLTQQTRRSHPFTIDAVAVLPDRIHTVWTLLAANAYFAACFASDQIGLFAQLPAGERISDSRAAKGERGVRQWRYWEHIIRHENDFRAAC